MHGHGSDRAERVRPNVFWDKSESGRAKSTGIGPEDGVNVQGADRAEPLVDRIVADWGGGWAPVFSHVEKDVDTRSE